MRYENQNLTFVLMRYENQNFSRFNLIVLKICDVTKVTLKLPTIWQMLI